MTYPVRVSETQYYGYGDGHTVDLPTGANGQTILLFIGSNGNPTMSTAPSGFTLVDSWTSGTAAKVFLYYRVTDGSEGSTVSFTLSANHDVRCRLQRFRNLRSGTVSDWLDVAPYTGSDGWPGTDWGYPANFSDDEFFCHLGYAFIVGQGTLDVYPDYLTSYQDFDRSTGTDDDVVDTVAARFSTFNEFPYGYWSLLETAPTNSYLALAVSLRGDTLGIVGEDYSAEYSMGGWVRSEDYDGTFEWNFPEQPTSTLSPAYSVFVFTDNLSTVYEDTFTGAAGSVYSHTPDTGTDYGYGFGLPGDDTTPPRLTGGGWLAPYAGGGTIYITQPVAVTEDTYAAEWTVKLQGEDGGGQTCELLLRNSSNQFFRGFFQLLTGNLSLEFSVSSSTGYDYHNISYGDATSYVGDTFVLRMEVKDNSLVAVYVDSVLRKVLAPGGVIPTPDEVVLYGYSIGESGGTPNWVYDHALLEQQAVGGTVTSDLTAEYDAYTAVGQSLSAEWGYPEQATSSLSGQYQLLLGVSRDLTIEFMTGFDPVSQDLSAEFDLYTVVGSSYSDGYEVDSVLPSIAAKGYVSFQSQSTPVDEQIPIPAGGRVGDIVFVTYAGSSSGINAVYDPGLGYWVRNLELDGQAVSRLRNTFEEDEHGWYHRITGSEVDSYLVLPAEYQYTNASYKFFVFILRNIFEYTPGALDFRTWVDDFLQNTYASGSPTLFQLPNAYLWHEGYTTDNWKQGNYCLQVAMLQGVQGDFNLDVGTIGYPDQFPRDRGVWEKSALASKVTIEYPPTYYASQLPQPPDYPANPNAQYFEAPEFVNSSRNVRMFLFRGVEPIRADLLPVYDIQEYVGSNFSAVWFANPLYHVAFDFHYGLQPKAAFVVDYRLDPKPIAAFDVSYSLHPTIKVGFEVSYSDKAYVAFDVGGTLGTILRVGFDASNALVSKLRVGFPFSWSMQPIAMSFDVGGVLGTTVRLGFEVSSAFVSKLNVGFGVSYSDRAHASFDVRGLLGTTVRVGFDFAGALVSTLRADFPFSWSMQSVALSFDVGASLISKIKKDVEVVSALIERVVSGADIGYEIRNTNHLVLGFDLGYSLSDDSQIITASSPFAYVDGKAVELLSADVAADEGGDVWEGSITLSKIEDFQLFPVSKEFSLLFAGEEYELMVDSRSISRSTPTDVAAVIYGVSPAKKYQTPRASPINKTWDTDMLASSIATEVIPTLQWETIDWVVAANTFGAEDASPLDVVKNLADVVGAVFESLPDGTMRVRPRFPVSVPNYGEATYVVDLSDTEDNFTYSEKYTPNKLENLITITDSQDNQANDRAEFTLDDGEYDRGVIRVYPAVWRDTVSIRPTGDIISYQYTGVEQREVTEEVEFVAGKASVQYPIVDIVSKVWNTADLGDVGFEFYQTSLTSSQGDGYSLLSVTYLTQAHTFRVVGSYYTKVQFVVEDA